MNLSLLNNEKLLKAITFNSLLCCYQWARCELNVPSSLFRLKGEDNFQCAQCTKKPISPNKWTKRINCKWILQIDVKCLNVSLTDYWLLQWVMECMRWHFHDNETEALNEFIVFMWSELCAKCRMFLSSMLKFAPS